MVNIKVFELLEEQKLDIKELKFVCRKLGIQVKSPLSILDTRDVKRILAGLEQKKKDEAAEIERAKAEAEEKAKKEAEARKEAEIKKAREARKKEAEAKKKEAEARKREAEASKKEAEALKNKAATGIKEFKESKKEPGITDAGQKKEGKAGTIKKTVVESAAPSAKKTMDDKTAPAREILKVAEEDITTEAELKEKKARELEKKEKDKESARVVVKEKKRKIEAREREELEEEVSEIIFEREDGSLKGRKGHPKRMGWEEEKKISIQSVLSKELDKEEKTGRLKAKYIQRKTGAGGLKSKDILKSKEKTSSKEKKKRPEIKKVLEIPEGITIKQISEKINVSSSEIIAFLFSIGEAYTINQAISKELLEYLSNEYKFKYRIIGFEEKFEEVYQDKEEDLMLRPPIVTIMGHVDHGKTTLLDSIRKTKVAVDEAGGITQRIGAYQIEYNGRNITFIDTPGHEAFTSIRARGAQVTDIAIIVIAADDGIMPQSIEAIDHAKDAGVPIIVAINKIDLPNADVEKVKKSLTEHGLVPEEWGGDTVVVEISAKNNVNLDELLEMILLVADMNEIKGNPGAGGIGIIIESRLDKGLGPIGTVIVKRGSIKIGDSFVTGDSYGRIRTIKDYRSINLKEGVLSQPIEVTGFTSVPKAGDKLFIVKDEKTAKELLSKKEYTKKMMQVSESRKVITLENLVDISHEEEIKKLKIILKAESEGSIDAVEKSLKKIEHDKIKINIIHKAIGAITESDILLAAAANAIVIGFGVEPILNAEILSKKEKVEIRTYDIIYKLIDDIKLAFEGLLEPEVQIIEKGKAEVREIFKVSKIGLVAGSYILNGLVERGNMARLIRDGEIVHEGKVDSLHRFKEDVKNVAAGYECGVRLENYQDVRQGDMLEFFEIRK
ncbi:MAG: translation initiation factor IF-2 [Actinobacteria bacterium]|nr:translation initiation factor IF-2 [Actinomycetota bacterium]